MNDLLFFRGVDGRSMVARRYVMHDAGKTGEKQANAGGFKPGERRATRWSTDARR
jgi:hypothetical protein